MDGSSEAAFDVSRRIVVASVLDADKVKFVFLARRALGCSSSESLIVTGILMSLEGLDLLGLFVEVMESVKTSLQSHLNSMAFADKLTLKINVQQAWKKDRKSRIKYRDSIRE